MSAAVPGDRVTRLVRPDVALHETWAAAMAELHAESAHVHGGGLFHLPSDQQWDLTEDGCRRLVDVLLAAADEPEDPAHVPCEYTWVTDGREVIGMMALRTRLNAWLLEQGGHIGYAIVPSRRRQGHATRALALAVRRAAELGIDRVLVTCDDDNTASAATIERGGGVLEDVCGDKRRYWIATRPGSDGGTAAPA